MTLKERDAIEGYDDEVSPRFVPSFAKAFNVMDGTCTACGQRVGHHWVKLNGNAEGWGGCAVALAIRVAGEE